MEQLLTIRIQDGENTYDQYYIIENKKQFQEIVDGYDSFERAVKESWIENITEEEAKVLEKFGVV